MKDILLHSKTVSLAHPPYFQDGPTQIQAVVPGYDQLPADAIKEDILIFPEKFALTPTRRLVVLVPSGEIDETALARRVWQLAASSCFSVLYLALSPDVAQTAYQRRRLAVLAAVTSDQNIHAHASLCVEKDWRKALDRTLQHGDLLVCLASHQVSDYLIRRRMIGEILAETAGIPVYMFGGIKIGPAPYERQAIKEVLAWMAFISLMAVFFGVQVSIERSTARPLSTILLCLSVIVEIYFLAKINEWFR